jgi:tetratricopeptide (TPR) repeat protein
LLPAALRATFGQFLSDVRDRSAAGYRERVQRSLQKAWSAQEYEKVLDLLRDHPYVLSAPDMASVRADCCEHLKNFRAAALFFLDTAKFGPDDPQRIFCTGAHPVTLLSEGNVADAWEYVQHQLAVSDHPLPYMSASMIRQRQACQEKQPAQCRHAAEEQIRYCEQAWERYRRLPAKHQQHAETRNLMALCLQAGALTARHMDNRQMAAKHANSAISCDPTSSAPWTARGFVTYPSDEAVHDFHKAVSLGEPTYYPYFYLAHASLMAGDWPETVSWCERALAHQPRVHIKAPLLEMLAIARSQLGHNAEQIKKLFQEARSLDPKNGRTARNTQVFLEALAQAHAATTDQWDRSGFESAATGDSLKDWKQPILTKRGFPNHASIMEPANV